MSVFQFKKFSVRNQRSAMKVNTDGVLLGVSVTIKETDMNILDVGTGTGTIALICAQRLLEQNQGSGQRIDAIDIDEASATEAADNFESSPWPGNLKAYNAPFDDFATSCSRKYDLIVSNPPYFEESLTAPDERKSTARHTSDGLSYRDIFNRSSEILEDDGRIALVLPSDQENSLCRYARMCGFYAFRIFRIRTVPRKSPSRIVVEFSRKRCAAPVEENLTIQNEGKYTQEYLSLMHDFYLFA